MKIVINTCYGGFGLTQLAIQLYKEKGGSQSEVDEYNISRSDPIMIEVIEELGERAECMHAKLKIVEIPDGIDWEIVEYDGQEHIAEVHRTWS